LIYLDSAATSLLKPRAVRAAVVSAMAETASPGRGGHIYARRAADMMYECRENLAVLCGVEQPENIVFTFNATHGLNIAIRSIAQRGMRAFVSGYEHNSVMRPLYAIGVETVSPTAELFDSEAFLAEAEKLLPKVDFAVCTHVSNVFGWVFPVYELGHLCRRYGKKLIVDASQSAGVQELNFAALGAEFAAMPGHKGLLGPQGTGVLICKNEAKPLLYGGSGSESLLRGMPELLPERLEAGTPNTAGIAGLNEGVKFLLKKGVGNVRHHERMLLEEFVRPLMGEESVKLFYTSDRGKQCSVLSIVPRDMSCEALEEKMGRAGIAVRTGLHCAPSAHEQAGTLSTGSLRVSFSPFISSAQARTASHELKKFLKKA